MPAPNINTSGYRLKTICGENAILSESFPNGRSGSPSDRTTNATIRKPIAILYSVGISTNEANSHLTAEILAKNQVSDSKEGASQTKLIAGWGVTGSEIPESGTLVRCMIPLDIHVGDILAQQNCNA